MENTHFEDVLERYNKQNRIPQKVLDDVKRHFGDTVPSIEMLKRTLANFGYVRYFNEANLILSELYGVPLPQLSDRETENIKKMFDMYYCDEKKSLVVKETSLE